MSSNGHFDRAERRRRARTQERTGEPHLDPGSNYGINVGWAASDAEIETAKKGTHDQLVELMGDRRRGPVAWKIASAGPEADKMLADLWTPDVTEAQHDLYRRLRGLLREYGGFLVAALAEGEPQQKGNTP